MTKQEKQLLLIDLCSRLPYGVKIHETSSTTKMEPFIPLGIEGTNIIRKDYRCESTNYIGSIGIEMCLPYLRPMSSMTEEERGEFRILGGVMSYSPQHNTWAISAFAPEAYDWLNKKMFDYRGLISMGLALEAPENMYVL